MAIVSHAGRLQRSAVSLDFVLTDVVHDYRWTALHCDATEQVEWILLRGGKPSAQSGDQRTRFKLDVCEFQLSAGDAE